MNENLKNTSSNQEPLAWKIGMKFYRIGIESFFRFGGMRLLRRKYKPEDFGERMGELSHLNIPQGSLWLHAVSVGEAQTASAILQCIRNDPDANRRALPCVVSTVTETGRDMAKQLTGDIIDKLFYYPWDCPQFVQSALDTVKPACYVIMETEIWPWMLSELKRRNIPAFLANGRLSEKSLKNYMRQASFWRGVFSCLKKLCVRFESDREHFLALGVPDEKIIVTGDCKIDALLNRREAVLTEKQKWDYLKRDNAPLFVAGSTHEGEEEIVISAFREICRTHTRARLVIVPRKSERAAKIKTTILAQTELRAPLLSHLSDFEAKSADWDIMIVDKIGILFNLYAVADAAFVGKSLSNIQKGGQNPMEPALFGILVAHGPHMENFPDTNRMDKMGAAHCIHNDSELADVWATALTPESREKTRANCQAYYKTIGGAAQRTWEVLKESLPQTLLFSSLFRSC